MKKLSIFLPGITIILGCFVQDVRAVVKGTGVTKDTVVRADTVRHDTVSKGGGAVRYPDLMKLQPPKPVIGKATVKGVTACKINLPNVILPVDDMKSALESSPISSLKQPVKLNVPGNVTTPVNAVKVISPVLTNAASNIKKSAAARAMSINDAVAKKMAGIKTHDLSAGVSLENDFRYHPVPGGYNNGKIDNVFGIRGTVSAFGVPLAINVSNNQAAFNGESPISNNLYKIGLSPEMFSGALKNQLQQYSGLKNSLFHGADFTEYMHQTLGEQIPSMSPDNAESRNTNLGKYLGNTENLQNLIKMSPGQLKSKLASIADQEGKDGNKQIDSATRALNLSKADSVAEVITAIKTQLQKKGIDPERLLVEENYLSGKTNSSFNNSELLAALRERNPSGGFQSLLSNVKDFKLGSYGKELPGAMDNQGRFVNGSNVSIKVNGYPLTVGYGRLSDINSLKDAGYQNSVYASNRALTYLSWEAKRSIFGKAKFSIVSSFNGSSRLNKDNPTLPGGNAVTLTLTKFLKIASIGSFAVDLSKSTTLFNNNYQVGSEALLQNKAGIKSTNLTNDLFQSMAVGFRHELDLPGINASDNIYFNYGGLGYQNPSNNNSGSTMKYGGSFRKGLYNNKLIFNLRTDFRQMPLSYVNNDKWKNYQMQLTGRYLVTNRFNVSLKYLAGGTGKVSGGVSESVYNTRKYELDANDTYKIGKYFTTSHISIGNQTLNNSYASAFQSNLLNINYVQSIVFKSTSLTGTVFYNKELSGYKLIGNLLNSDVSYQYLLFKKLQLSSGVTYLNNVDIAKQVGVRQSIQVMPGKHFDISASVDLRHNLIAPKYADLYAATRGELSLKYYLKTN